MQLYTLLCGPVLRRVEPSKVCIWLATSIQPEECDAIINLLYKNKGDNKWIEKYIITHTKYNVHQLGSNLFVILLEITPAEGESAFKPLTPYGYDIHFRFSETDKVILNDKDIYSKKGAEKEVFFTKIYNTQKQYSYADLPYPVFVIPQQDTPNTRIFYGSCRKTHGHGSDALNTAAKYLEEQWKTYSGNQKKEIPDHVIFHLGDQIYTDDLNEKVFDAVQDLALSIMGYEEIIPAYVNAKEITNKGLTIFLYNYLDGVAGFEIEDLNLPAKITYADKSIPGNRRKNIHTFVVAYLGVPNCNFIPNILLINRGLIYNLIDKRAPDILEHFLAHSPLIDLNEVLPREYLRTNLPTQLVKVKDIKYKDRKGFVRRNSSITTEDDGHLISMGEFAALYLLNWGRFKVDTTGYKVEAIPATIADQFSSVWLEKEENLEGLIKMNANVIRLFANVPSYMIFDDHDVTDDWNCDIIWRNAVERSVTGKRLVSNALAAYWAFQGWGNNPGNYPDDFISAMIDHLKNPLYNQGVDDQSKAKKFEDSLFAFQDWAFIAPTNPIGIFLDNRTLRGGAEEMDYNTSLNENKMYKGARLMSQVAFDKIEALIKSVNYKSGTPLICCAPTPIIGSTLFEAGQLHMVDGTFNTDTILAGFKPKSTGRYDNDYECWRANPRGKYEFFNFIDTKIKPSKVIILSGDVHYGFHTKCILSSSLTRSNYDIDQFSSSALKNNTLDKLDKINLLADLSFFDTKDEKYKQVNELYPFPNPIGSQALTPHFALKGHLVKYTKIIDEDTWLIFRNNIGLLNVSELGKTLITSNLFLYAAYYDSPVIVSAPAPLAHFHLPKVRTM
ncbi:hypothetical protein CLV51_1011523 [Chitinophaga niastensis]|uniref:PhoD-like phosphatase n=1 Tax=Chitinophaga niastensis TaxID=536980 RepID=A0A2P8HVC0_CHINA|nr:hypothetical protein [Chitinophaga niastensis]PSL50179.1 hypothetical protein CLV51_1011523 [Chitinophaga niastensis]